jgi:hypothetical protein
MHQQTETVWIARKNILIHTTRNQYSIPYDLASIPVRLAADTCTASPLAILAIRDLFLRLQIPEAPAIPHILGFSIEIVPQSAVPQSSTEESVR